MNAAVSPREIIESGLCIGCGSCAAQAASQGVRMRLDSDGLLKPKGPSAWYRKGSPSFARTCPFSPTAPNEAQLSLERYPEAKKTHTGVGRFNTAYVGHAAEWNYRGQGSSGGMVTWVAAELLRRGWVDGVAHVVAADDPHVEARYFKYRLSHSEAEVRDGAKARYYPIELSNMLQAIRGAPGRYAVVGLPCFIKAVHLLRREDPLLRERIVYTLGLFCGHMKSARFVESLAWQMHVPLKEVRRVDFRHKDPNRPANWYNAMLTLNDGRVAHHDWWHLKDGDWGAGFFMSHACNYCDDVVAETADISFGDAWVEPYASDGKGTSVVMVRSSLLDLLIGEGIRDGRLELEEVDGAFVERTQAAGIRQRREGLAYRLTWRRGGVRPVKRVAADHRSQSPARIKIYRMRYAISLWSHRMFRLARRLGWPGLYLGWARVALSVYHAYAYHAGEWAEMRKRFSQMK